MLSLQEFVQNRYNKTIAECSNEELYLALLNYSKLASSKKPVNTGKKKVYYISAEFLIGKLLSNNLINLGLYDEVKKELAAAGKELIEIEEVELEPSLGNGGLGRLAACFIDSISRERLKYCSFEEYKNRENKFTEMHHIFLAKKYDFDILKVSTVGLFFSERLINYLKEAKITGLDFFEQTLKWQ